MLDLLEAGVDALRSNSGQPLPNRGLPDGGGPGQAVVSPQELRARMAAGPFCVGEIANALSVPRKAVDDWLSGKAAIPSWVPVAMRMIALLTPSARRKLQNGAASYGTKTELQKPHPFSKIEEL
jgi:hypothetical protein